MNYLQRILFSSLGLVILIVLFNAEIGTETVTQAYYTQESLMYEETFVREGTTTKWQLGWPPRVTVPQVQYGLKNTDSVEGEFSFSISFDNDSDRTTVHKRVALAPGQEKTVVVGSPLQGPQSFKVAITPPTKQVKRLREVEVSYTVYDKLWQLMDLRSLLRLR